MAIYKAKTDQFVTIPNKTIQDKELSIEATGLLAFILSLPEDWEIHKKWIIDQKSGITLYRVNKIFKELQHNNYMRKKAKRSPDGSRFAGWDWFVYPTKVDQKTDYSMHQIQTHCNTDALNYRRSVFDTEYTKETSNTNKTYKTKKTRKPNNTHKQDPDSMPTPPVFGWIGKDVDDIDFSL